LVAELQRERLRVLTDRIVMAQEDERLRISRELHDEAGQALTSLKISLDLIRGSLPAGQEELRQRLTDLAALTGETMDTLRMLAHDLRPPGLDAFGLNVALEGLCRDFSVRTSMPIEYEGSELPQLPASLNLSLYRFTQEAFTNIAKHAEANKVSVRLIQSGDSLQLLIADDGKGFAYDPDDHTWFGIGLVSMQERITLLQGTLAIDSAPGRGTRLTARVPLGVAQDKQATIPVNDRQR
jgi:signal transduction histidine kinase